MRKENFREDTQLSYSKQQLGGSFPVLNLPLDRPRPRVQTFRGASQSRVLPKKLFEALTVLSRREGVTLFMTLLAAFKTLLYRYTAQGEIVVGCHIPNRHRAKIDGPTVSLSNTLVMRTDLSDDPSLRELLGRVREVVLESYTSQDQPFEEPQQERDLSHTPLPQVLFNLLDATDDWLELPGLTLRSFEVDRGIENFDLSLSMVEGKQQLKGFLEYNTDLFDATTVTRMLGHFQTLLEGIVANPEQRLSDLPLLTEAERDQLLFDWNDTSQDYPQDQCIHQLFEAQVRQAPDAVAVVFEDQRLTYRELNSRANQLAHYLRKHGVGPDVLVGICVDRSLEMVVGLLGILKAGGAYVPLDPEHPKARLAYMLEDTQVRLLLTQEGLLKNVLEYEGKVLCLDRDQTLFEGEEEANPDLTTKPEHLAYVVYTSGSTGKPKGVLSRHRGVVNYLAYLVNAYEINSTDIVLQVASLSFDASVRDIIGPLTAGAQVIVVNNKDAKEPLALLSTIKERRVTCLLSLVPTMLTGLLEASRDCDLSSYCIRIILVSGEALYLSTCCNARNAFGVRALVVNQYGPTECTMTSTYHPVHIAEDNRDIVLIGRPIPNCQIYILDGNLNPVPIGVTGEVHIGGVGLSPGYLNRPDLTGEKFISNPFDNEPGAQLYKTGDLARYLPDSNIEFVGRTDYQVKIGGIRIELEEIESVLLRYENIKECAVVVSHPRRLQKNLISNEGLRTTNANWGDQKRLVAYVAPRIESTRSELRNFLEKELPPYMIPGLFIKLDALPLNANGKLDVQALPELENLRPEFEEAFVAPRNAVESLIAEVWQDVLGIDRVGVNDSFFELGGDSLLAMRVLNQLRQAANLDIHIQSLFESRTVAQLARLIQRVERSKIPQRRADLKNSLSVLPTKLQDKKGPYPLSFAEQGIWFLWKLEPNNPYYIARGIIELHGQLNLTIFMRAWQALLQRHEMLRVRFDVEGDKPIQVFEDRQEIHLPVTDLSDLPEAERHLAVRRVAQEEIENTFDLERDSLLRTQLFKLSDNEHALLLTMHEIIIDIWSVRILLRDLGKLYDGFLKGKTTPLAPLRVNFSDFVLWEQQHVTRHSLAVQEKYWRGELSGELSIMALPFDRPRPKSPNYSGKSISVLLDTALTRQLKTLSREEDSTLFMTLLAAFNALLHVYTDQDDLIIGAPIANRNNPATEHIVGFCLNMLPLRTDLSGKPSFKALLGQARKTVTGAINNGDYPFMWMLDLTETVRDPNVTPIFQVMFNMLNYTDFGRQHRLHQLS